MLMTIAQSSLLFVASVCLVSFVEVNAGDQCISTGMNCIRSCVGLPDDDYQSCRGCSIYASCVNGVMNDRRPCPSTTLHWDDIAKRCEHTSRTCTCYPPPTTTMMTTRRPTTTTQSTAAATSTEAVTTTPNKSSTASTVTPTTTTKSSHAQSACPSRTSVLGLLVLSITCFHLAM